MEQKPFQTAGTEFLKEQGRAILGDDPGLGKTNQALFAAEGRILIVCPAMLQKVWHDEIGKWTPDLDHTIVSYSSLCHRAADSRGYLSRVQPFPRPEYGGRWDTVIADESHYLKARNTLWSRAVRRLETDRLFLLTGTPVPNWAHEIYMLLLLTHPKDPRFTNYRNWLLRWFDVWKPPWGGTKVMGLKKGTDWGKFVVGNDLDECFLRRTREEVLPDLPPLTEQVIRVEMTAEQKRFYKALKKDYIAFTKGGVEVSAWSDGGLHTKLMQACTGPELFDHLAAPGGKMSALADLFADRQHLPMVVFTSFRATGNLVQQVASEAGRRCAVVHGGISMNDRQLNIDMFKTGQFDTLVGTLETLAEGLTLTEADTCVFVERSWRPSRNEQAMRRLHRIGQTRPVTVIKLITQDSVDERMESILDKKEDQVVKMLSAAEFARLL